MKKYLILIVVGILGLIWWSAHFPKKNDGTIVVIKNTKFLIKLKEFKNPVKVGISAPKLHNDLKELVNFAIIKNPASYSYEERVNALSNLAAAKVTREQYEILRTKTILDNPDLFRVSVDYLVEAKLLDKPERYLMVCYRYGYFNDFGKWSEQRVINPMVFERNEWRGASFSHPHLNLITECIKFDKLDDVKKLIAEAK